MVDLQAVLEQVAAGELTPAAARERIEGFTRVDDFARFDTQRDGRTNVPEVVLGEGKSVTQLEGIATEALDRTGLVVITRIDAETQAALEPIGDTVEWHDEAGVLVMRAATYESPDRAGTVAVVTGGTADIPVATEAVVTAEELGCAVETLFDVGVAGVHRLLPEVDRLDAADSVVVAAGREGALATLIAGLVEPPVIGLPVSVGYGYGGDGEAALASMLQSCSVLSVVNIDAGFVAGAQAAQIARSS